jgi:hypothetical protein
VSNAKHDMRPNEGTVESVLYPQAGRPFARATLHAALGHDALRTDHADTDRPHDQPRPNRALPPGTARK